jgi:hypothetical protein
MKSYIRSIPNIRFVPKKMSVRAITNLSTGGNKLIQNFSSVNNNLGIVGGDVLSNNGLYNCFHVLKHIYNQKPSLGGFGVFGLDEVHEKFRRFKQNLSNDKENVLQNKSNVSNIISENFEEQKYYFASIDLEKCYDNVNTNMLYDLLKSLLISDSSDLESDINLCSNQQNMIHKYNVCHKIESLNRQVVKNIKFVSTSGDIVSFVEASGEINCFFVCV